MNFTDWNVTLAQNLQLPPCADICLVRPVLQNLVCVPECMKCSAFIAPGFVEICSRFAVVEWLLGTDGVATTVFMRAGNHVVQSVLLRLLCHLHLLACTHPEL
eukprot:m.224442 g.224442  ORF g.224442 m.224442 type:complete len:103 (-) comp15147_c0_seq33:2279-2587(-)